MRSHATVDIFNSITFVRVTTDDLETKRMLSQGGHSSPARQPMDGHSAARMVSGGYSVGELQPGYAAAPSRGGYPRGGVSATLVADAGGPFFYVRGAGQSGEQHE